MIRRIHDDLDAAAVASDPAGSRARLDRTGAPERLTADGQVIGIVMSPAAFAKLQSEHDTLSIERADADIAAGRISDGFAKLDELKQRLAGLSHAVVF